MTSADTGTTGPGQTGGKPAGQEDNVVAALVKRSEALTGIARTAWITLIAGCLYGWLTLAALNDIDLFQPASTLTLPIVASPVVG